MSTLPAEEWRVEVDLDDERHGYSLSERLRALDLDDEMRERLGRRVIVTRDGSRLFLYTRTVGAARTAESVVREQLAADELTADVRVARWDAKRDAWVAPDGEIVEDAKELPDEDALPSPVFVFLEAHKPEIARDLGL
jgi:hypothetical protein